MRQAAGKKIQPPRDLHPAGSPPLSRVIEARLTRRDALKGLAAA